MTTEAEIINHIYLRTIQFVFQQRQYDQRFIEVGTEKGLSQYFQELDLDTCDLKECIENIRVITKSDIPELDYMLIMMYNNLLELYGILLED